MVKVFILLANICLPVFSIVLAIKYSATPYRWLYSILIAIHVAARMWETFFTSKERDPRKFEGDWTLAVGTFAYIALCFAITSEFFLIPRERCLGGFIVGSLLYLFAARLRWWGQVTLGKQWAIHVVGDQKTKKKRLLQIGPYEFIRHPIYTGILIEELALPLMASAYYAFFLVFLVNIPLLLIRLREEENRSLLNFREDYARYAKKTGRFFPPMRRYFQFLKKVIFDVSR